MKNNFFFEILLHPLKYIRKSIFYIRNYRFTAFFRRVREKVVSYYTYQKWIKKNEPDKGELEEQRKVTFSFSPLISIVIPVYNTDEVFLREMIESLLGQTYSNWEICIADGGSSKEYIKTLLSFYSEKDKRIKVKFLRDNKGIALNSNEALSLASGDYIGLLDHDDILPPFALFEVVKKINEHPEVDYIYSDEDKISGDGKSRFEPFFKPDWSPHTLMGCNYPTHFSVFSKTLIQEIGGFQKGFDGSQDYDLILRATEKAKRIVHIRKILYHWRTHMASTALNISAKLYAYDSAKKALLEHFKRTGDSVEHVEDIFTPGYYRPVYKTSYKEKVSVIITGESNSIIKRCIYSVLNKTSYKNYEIIAVSRSEEEFYKEDNIKFIKLEKEFNASSVYNYAVKQASGSLILFLKGEVLNSDFIESMTDFALKKEIGAVGGKICYSDNTLCHGGFVIGLCGSVGSPYRYEPANYPGYFGILQIVRNVSAVSGDCLMVRREVFLEAGGFNERFVSLYDVDFCLNLLEKGYFNIWTPWAEICYIGKSNKREHSDRDLFLKRWKDFISRGDPFYNPNLSLNREDYSIKI